MKSIKHWVPLVSALAFSSSGMAITPVQEVLAEACRNVISPYIELEIDRATSIRERILSLPGEKAGNPEALAINRIYEELRKRPDLPPHRALMAGLESRFCGLRGFTLERLRFFIRPEGTGSHEDCSGENATEAQVPRPRIARAIHDGDWSSTEYHGSTTCVFVPVTSQGDWAEYCVEHTLVDGIHSFVPRFTGVANGVEPDPSRYRNTVMSAACQNPKVLAADIPETPYSNDSTQIERPADAHGITPQETNAGGATAAN